MKFTDPTEREQLVDEYLKNRKAVQQDFLAERIGEYNLLYDMSKAFKPITEQQAAMGKEFTFIKDSSLQHNKALLALPASLASQLKAIAATSTPAIREPDIVGKDPIRDVAKLDEPKITQAVYKKDADETYGFITLGNGKTMIGEKEVNSNSG